MNMLQAGRMVDVLYNGQLVQIWADEANAEVIEMTMRAIAQAVGSPALRPSIAQYHYNELHSTLNELAWREQVDIGYTNCDQARELLEWTDYYTPVQVHVHIDRWHEEPDLSSLTPGQRTTVKGIAWLWILAIVAIPLFFIAGACNFLLQLIERVVQVLT